MRKSFRHFSMRRDQIFFIKGESNFAVIISKLWWCWLERRFKVGEISWKISYLIFCNPSDQSLMPTVYHTCIFRKLVKYIDFIDIYSIHIFMCIKISYLRVRTMGWNQFWRSILIFLWSAFFHPWYYFFIFLERYTH